MTPKSDSVPATAPDVLEITKGLLSMCLTSCQVIFLTSVICACVDTTLNPAPKSVVPAAVAPAPAPMVIPASVVTAPVVAALAAHLLLPPLLPLPHPVLPPAPSSSSLSILVMPTISLA
ncbi:hypothetical protein ARMGADRAFT_1087643 [Armillaria gallica]|uniref:Uncharacterized protein n=1 Tax=Armillaria gallica TaxID=47427 RepID=A0A2H3CUS1_ARMGA|nr:hypothetical protein ARMGADRAFT_1087643 [Armillaria gallica]